MNEELHTEKHPPPHSGKDEMVGPVSTTDDVDGTGTLPYIAPPLIQDSSLPANFELIGWVAEGGQGVIFKAWQLNPRRMVAIKMIKAGEYSTESQVKSFLDEANKQARLDHHGILAIYECGTHNNRPYIAMEFCAGGTLGEAFHNKPVFWRTAASLIAYLARVLDKAHSHGVIHRDLKPANLLIKEPISGLEALSTEHLRIADFGLALDKNAGLSRKTSYQDGSTGRFAGTPHYMAPEQSEDARKVGPAADIYSLGVVLYEMLTGTVPINAPTLGEFISKLRTDTPVSPRRLASRCPRDLEAICLKCLRKDPKGRYASAGQLAEDLEAVLADNPLIYARPVGWVERMVMWGWRNKALATSLAVAVVALIAGGIISTWLYINLAMNIEALQSQRREVAMIASKEAIKRLNDSKTGLRLVQGLANTVQENNGQILLKQAIDEKREHINLRLAAVLCGDPSHVMDLLNGIHRLAPADLKVLADCLQPFGIQEYANAWWKVVQDVNKDGDHRIRHYGVLAVCKHANTDWAEKSSDIVNLLMEQDLVAVGDWAELFKPVGKHLVKALLGVLASEKQTGDKTANVDRPRLAAEYLHRFTDNNAEEKALFAISVPSELVPWLKRKAILSSGDKEVKAALMRLSTDKKQPARLRAHAAAQLVLMDDWKPALAKMGFDRDPTERTWVINRLIVLKPDIRNILSQYSMEISCAIANCAILDIICEFAPMYDANNKNVPGLSDEWENVVDFLHKEWRANPHPGVHAGAERVLRKLNQYVPETHQSFQQIPGSPSGPTTGWRVNEKGMTLVRIAPGQTYKSGSPNSESERNPALEEQIERKLDYTFEIGAREVGKDEFFRLIPADSHQHRKEWFAEADPSINDVSFYEAARFCNELSRSLGIEEEQRCYEIKPTTAMVVLKPDFLKLKGYRLPTEVEWEFACRAGTVSAFCFGNVPDHLTDYANYSWSRKDKMTPRGSFRPNFLGLFDMHGNVMEWAHGSISRTQQGETDAVLRGGPWHNGPAWCRSAARNPAVLTNKGFSTGFRVARTVIGDAKSAE